ncbi:MAG: hypothetical protein ABI406_06370 [Ktedonobacteraceae bacterium]
MSNETDMVLGIDAGTVGIRAGLFDLNGQPLGFSEQSYTTLLMSPVFPLRKPLLLMLSHWGALCARLSEPGHLQTSMPPDRQWCILA